MSASPIPAAYAAAVLPVLAPHCTCQRCGHRWVARVRYDEQGQWLMPRICGRCKSLDWHRPYTAPEHAARMKAWHRRQRDQEETCDQA